PRAVVGVGEAAYGTSSPALLADYFPRERRGRVFAIFFAAIPIGSALGYVVGGLADRYFGWRPAFFVAGVPGLLLAALALRLHEPPRGAQEPDVVAPAWAGRSAGAATRAAYAALLRNRTYVLTVLGYAAYTFAIGALAFWTPSFLERARQLDDRERRVPTRAGHGRRAEHFHDSHPGRRAVALLGRGDLGRALPRRGDADHSGRRAHRGHDLELCGVAGRPRHRCRVT